MMSVPVTRLLSDASGSAVVSDPACCVQRVRAAISAHDLDALMGCFAHDYQSEFPAHPERSFQGHVQLRENWSQFFERVPDIQADLLRTSEDGQTIWAEWEWHGTHVDGVPFLQRGVTIQEVHAKRIVWVRLYVEPVASDGHGIADTLQRSNP